MQPLTHTRIGYDSITKRATISASGALTGFPAAAAANDLTYAFWSAGLPATWQAQLEEAEACDYFGVAAHTLWSNHAMVVMQAWIDAAWQTMPVLTGIGDLWRFDGDFYGERGGAPSATLGTLRRGIAVDGLPIHPFYDDGANDYLGERDSKFGKYSLTVEPAIINFFSENVRNGGDTSEDTTGFGWDVSYSTDRAVSGAGSIFVTIGGGTSALKTEAVPVYVEEAYTFQCKFECPQTVNVAVSLYGDVSGLLGSSVQFGNVAPGAWNVLQITRTTGASDTTVYATVVIYDGSGYVDELQIEFGSIAHTWVDGFSDADDLAYQPEILQQIADDCTISFWVRMPDTAWDQNFLSARTLGGNSNVILIRNPANTHSIAVTTSDAAASFNNLYYDFTWGQLWHMVTAVIRPGVSGEHNKLLYIDGKLATSVETALLPTWSDIDTFDVGHIATAGRLGSDGESLMDDLLILNRAATATEIKAWYDSGETTDLATVGLPAHADDRPIMTLVEEQISHRYRLRFVGQSTPVVGVVSMGKALEMARPIYGGQSPINLSRRTVVRPNVSERGQWLGRSIIRSGAGGSWSWANLTAAWVRRYLGPFLESSRTLPFFVLWRPATFPGEAAYCWTLQDPAPPTNSGPRDLMAFVLDAEGLGHE